MPPRAIASSVWAAIARAGSEPWRSRNASTIDGGNFGAPPKPPRSASYSPPSTSTARSTTARSTGAATEATGCRRCSRSFAATRWTSSPRLTQASLIEASTCRKLGWPWRGWSGK